MKNCACIIAFILLVICFAGCQNKKTETTENSHRVEIHEDDRIASVELDPVVGILVDNSLSTEGFRDQLEAEAQNLSDNKVVATWYFSDQNGKDTDLVNAINQATRCDVIYLLTDGWQDPYSGKGWSDLGQVKFIHQDIHFICPEKTEHTENLVNEIKNHSQSFPGSSVTVEYLDGTKSQVIFDNYVPVTGIASYKDKWNECYQDESRINGYEDESDHKMSWWKWLLLLLLLPLLGLLLWWLFGRKKDEKEDDEKSSNSNETVVKDPVKPVDHIEQVKTVPETVSETVPETVSETVPKTQPHETQLTTCNCCRCCCCHCCRSTPAQVVTAVATTIIAVISLSAGIIALWNLL